MTGKEDFIKAYFIQTRQEIDTEKRERDQILHFVILVLGAMGFAIIQSDKAQVFLSHPCALITEFGTLILILTLFWIRRKKLHQISDRWFVLHSLLKTESLGVSEDISMEAIVIPDLQTTRYTRKDVWLNWSVSLPIWSLVAVTFCSIGLHKWVLVLLLFSGLIIQWIVSFIFLGRSFKCPDLLKQIYNPSDRKDEPIASEDLEEIPRQGN